MKDQEQKLQGWTENGQRREPLTRILATKRCRDCPAEFVLADTRQILCAICRKEARRANHRRQMQAWWRRQSSASRSALYKRQWEGQQRRLHNLPPELQGVVMAIGNLRRRISEEQNRRSA